ncbi:LysR family transcriptional regulator [Salinisphaera sp. T31B1]|uniref:LysR family transcriptional regulator n=1 Tax=Salinisphaera sp. T31B1 TaxID=727963 RepID=UPI00333FE71D
MNLSWLEDFMALAASGNFSRAAASRHMTQPAFSRRIRALEQWVGTELFDRSSQPARLTAAGDWFEYTAVELLERIAQVPAQTRAVAAADAGELRFAATHALSFTFVPGWLQRMERRAAVGRVSLVSDVRQRCAQMLLAGQVDFVLGHAHPQAPSELDAQSCPSLLIGDDVLLPVAAANAAGEPRYLLTHASPGSPIAVLGYSNESGIGRILHMLKGDALEHASVTRVFTAHLASVLRTMALDGRGIAWLPRTLIADDLAAGRLSVAADAGWHVALEVRLYRGHGPLAAASEAFWRDAHA